MYLYDLVVKLSLKITLLQLPKVPGIHLVNGWQEQLIKK